MMEILPSFIRISEKIDIFGDIFGYLIVAPVVPKAVIFGPQSDSDEFEKKLDKCILDKVDYFAEEFGYNPEKIRAYCKENEYVFID